MINLSPGLVRQVLEDPRFQDDGGLDIGVMKKSERLFRVSPASRAIILILEISCRGMSVSKEVFICEMSMLLV